MKNLKFFAAAMVLVAAVSCSSGNTGANKSAGKDSTAVAEKPINPEAFKPSKSLVDSVSYLLGVNWGSMVKGYNFGDLNYKQVMKGINDFINAKGNQRDTNFVKQFKIDLNQMGEIINGYLEKRQFYVAAKNRISEEEFLEANKAKKGVQVTESGLQYILQDAGTGEKPGPKDTVYVHYKLTNKDGDVIEEVKDGEKSAKLYLNRVIPGWTEGLQLLKEGGKATLYVPSKLGYGERGSQGIEPNSPLIFDIKLDSVRHYVEPVKEDKK
jgi:FKBP-type peptidyl-prolyl cis-trans isomerase